MPKNAPPRTSAAVTVSVRPCLGPGEFRRTDLKGNVVVAPNKVFLGVVVQRTPVRLHCNTIILDDFLAFGINSRRFSTSAVARACSKSASNSALA